MAVNDAEIKHNDSQDAISSNGLDIMVTKEQNQYLNKYGFHCNKNGKIVHIQPLTHDETLQHNPLLPLPVVHEFIQNIFQTQYKMNKISIQSKFENDILSSNIFISPNYQNKTTLLLIITGFGKINAGEWSTSICSKDNIIDGTAIPFISYAYTKNWGVILFDTNGIDNNKYDQISEKDKIYEKIHLGSVHCVDVFDKYITALCQHGNDKMILESVVMLAHSAGGRNVTYLLEKRGTILGRYIKRIAFTDIKDPLDQIKQIKVKGVGTMIKNIYKNCARNWVKTKQQLPLNNPIKSSKNKYVIQRFSAGHKEHKYTTSSAMSAILSFFDEI
eukprot:462845_1